MFRIPNATSQSTRCDGVILQRSSRARDKHPKRHPTTFPERNRLYSVRESDPRKREGPIPFCRRPSLSMRTTDSRTDVGSMDADAPTPQREVVSHTSKTVAPVREEASPISVFHRFGERRSPPKQHVMAAAERPEDYDSGAGIASPVHVDMRHASARWCASSRGDMLDMKAARRAKKAARAAELEVKLLEERQSLLVDLEGLARCLRESTPSRQCSLESLEKVFLPSHVPAARSFCEALLC